MNYYSKQQIDNMAKNIPSKKAEDTGEVMIKFLLWIAVFVILAIAIFTLAKKYVV